MYLVAKGNRLKSRVFTGDVDRSNHGRTLLELKNFENNQYITQRLTTKRMN